VSIWTRVAVSIIAVVGICFLNFLFFTHFDGFPLGVWLVGVLSLFLIVSVVSFVMEDKTKSNDKD
jgi:uncharacterized membrane protein YqhA